LPPTLHAGPHSFELLPTGEDAPHLFAKGVISTPGDEAGGVFSPDGREFYFAQMNPTTTFPRVGLLCVSHWNGKSWSPPEALPFSGKYLDFPPRLSPDGKTMYFASRFQSARAAHLASKSHRR
jgi:Tol biopolymer transport system component